MDIFSFGGGVQSTAALVLASRGELDCKAFVFANVGDDSENPETLDYIRNFSRPFAEAHGIELVEVTKGVSLYQHTLTANRTIDIPMRMENGAPGNRKCTYEWKIAVIARWAKARFKSADTIGVGLGISVDEFQRMADSKIKYIRNEYPLIDMRLTRLDCQNLIDSAGLPPAPKSACFFCPFHTVATWKTLARTPELFERAVALETRINEIRDGIGKDHVYLTSYGRPLTDVVQDNGQLSLLPEDSCETGYCMT
jgi:hypothetical protein